MLLGGEGGDVLSGDDGDDVVNGDSGDDVLSGGDGDDVMDGGAGDDVVNGDDGDDVLAGGDDFDIVDGGDGTDSGALVGGRRTGVASGGNDDITLWSVPVLRVSGRNSPPSIFQAPNATAAIANARTIRKAAR